MLPFDVSQLIMRYNIELYRLPKWIDKSAHSQVLKLPGLGSNPRAARYIMKNLSDFPIERIASNPHPIVIEQIKSVLDANGLDEYLMCALMFNPSPEPNFIAWAENKINNFMGNQKQTLSSEQYDYLMIRALGSNRSKTFHDRYLLTNDDYSTRVFLNGHYPYFPNESDEINEQYFVSLLNRFPNIPVILGHIAAPPIIKKIEMQYGLAPPDSIQNPQIVDNLNTVFIGPDAFEGISANPGAINILKAKPELIDHEMVLENENIGELIECGLVSVDLPELIKLRTRDSKVFDAIKKSVKVPITNSDLISQIDVSNPYLFESYGGDRTIRLVTRFLY